MSRLDQCFRACSILSACLTSHNIPHAFSGGFLTVALGSPRETEVSSHAVTAVHFLIPRRDPRSDKSLTFPPTHTYCRKYFASPPVSNQSGKLVQTATSFLHNSLLGVHGQCNISNYPTSTLHVYTFSITDFTLFTMTPYPQCRCV